MDTFALVFYAAICGVLSILSPGLGTTSARFIVGAAVGAVATTSMPAIRAFIGF